MISKCFEEIHYTKVNNINGIQWATGGCMCVQCKYTMVQFDFRKKVTCSLTHDGFIYSSLPTNILVLAMQGGFKRYR